MIQLGDPGSLQKIWEQMTAQAQQRPPGQASQPQGQSPQPAAQANPYASPQAAQASPPPPQFSPPQMATNFGATGLGNPYGPGANMPQSNPFDNPYAAQALQTGAYGSTRNALGLKAPTSNGGGFGTRFGALGSPGTADLLRTGNRGTPLTPAEAAAYTATVDQAKASGTYYAAPISTAAGAPQRVAPASRARPKAT